MWTRHWWSKFVKILCRRTKLDPNSNSSETDSIHITISVLQRIHTPQREREREWRLYLCSEEVHVLHLPSSAQRLKNPLPAYPTLQHSSPSPIFSHIYILILMPPSRRALPNAASFSPPWLLPWSLSLSLSHFQFVLNTQLNSHLDFLVLQQKMEETYIMIKPDGVQRGLVSFNLLT